MADPLSRHPNIIAHMVLCAIGEGAATDADLMDSDGDRVADILAGYATDAWFADAANVTKAGLHIGRALLLLCLIFLQSRQRCCKNCTTQIMLGM